MFSLVWLMLFSYSNLVATQNLPNHNAALQPKNIFILAGQSNMSGRGGVLNGTWDGHVPPECRPDPSILRLRSDLTWEEAREPLHADIDVDKICGVGPAMAFSNSIMRKDSGIGVIGLVPCAIGGTNITQWRRGGPLYNQMLNRVGAAVRAGGGLIRAVLWYQGESDTVSHQDAKLYKHRLEKFFRNVRSDFLSPVLPVIQVALASGSGPYVDIVRKAQKEIDLPNVRCVDAYGLQLEPDGLHLTTAAQARLGSMIAESFLKITAPLPVQSSGGGKRLSHFLVDLLGRWFRYIYL